MSRRVYSREQIEFRQIHEQLVFTPIERKAVVAEELLGHKPEKFCEAFAWYAAGRNDEKAATKEIAKLEALWREPWYVRLWDAMCWPYPSRFGLILLAGVLLILVGLIGLSNQGQPIEVMSTDVARGTE